MRNYHVIFADLPDISIFDEGKIWSEKLQNELIKTHKSFSQINLTTPENIDFSKQLKHGEKNLIIFNTDKYAYVSPYLPKLKTKEKEFNLILFEQYNWLNQSNKLLQNIYISPFTPIIDSKQLTVFDSKFYSYFNRDPSTDIPRFELLCYDLTSYFLTLINRYGLKFTEKMGSLNNSGWIQSQPVFERISKGSGFINQKLYIGEEKPE